MAIETQRRECNEVEMSERVNRVTEYSKMQLSFYRDALHSGIEEDKIDDQTREEIIKQTLGFIEVMSMNMIVNCILQIVNIQATNVADSENFVFGLAEDFMKELDKGVSDSFKKILEHAKDHNLPI